MKTQVSRDAGQMTNDIQVLEVGSMIARKGAYPARRILREPGHEGE